MSSFVPVSVSYPRLFTRQVLELRDYQWNAAQQTYERVSFRALHMMEPDENTVDSFESGEFLPPRPILLGELQPSVQRRLVPPPRPPPPNFNRQGASAASPESPASPDGSEPYSPTDSPTKRTTLSPPLYSPDRLACDRSLYVARQDYQFALPMDCPGGRSPRTPVPFSMANPLLQPAPEPHHARIQRRVPPSPRPVGRGAPYARPTIPSEDSAFGRPRLPEICSRISSSHQPLLHPW